MLLDPITLEVLQTRFAEIVSTMEHLLFHSGYSTILRESYDGSAVLTLRTFDRCLGRVIVRQEFLIFLFYGVVWIGLGGRFLGGPW